MYFATLALPAAVLTNATIFHVISITYIEIFQSGTAYALRRVKQRIKHINPDTNFIRRKTMNTQTENINAWDRIMMAITFAEAGEAGTAREVISKRPAARIRKESAQRPQLRV